MSIEEREEQGQAILDAIAAAAAGSTPMHFPFNSIYRGYRLIIPRDVDPEKPELILSRQSAYKVRLGDKAGGVFTRIDNRLDRITNDLEQALEQIEALETRQTRIIKELNHEDTFDKEIEAIDQRLIEINGLLGLDKEEKR